MVKLEIKRLPSDAGQSLYLIAGVPMMINVRDYQYFGGEHPAIAIARVTSYGLLRMASTAASVGFMVKEVCFFAALGSFFAKMYASFNELYQCAENGQASANELLPFLPLRKERRIQIRHQETHQRAKCYELMKSVRQLTNAVIDGFAVTISYHNIQILTDYLANGLYEE